MLTTRSAVTAVALALLIMSCGILSTRRITATEIDEMLRTSIHIGSHHSRIAMKLDSLGVEHSTYDVEKREIVAIWRRTSTRFFDETAVQGRFLFDSEGRLKHYKLQELVIAT